MLCYKIVPICMHNVKHTETDFILVETKTQDQKANMLFENAKSATSTTYHFLFVIDSCIQARK